MTVQSSMIQYVEEYLEGRRALGYALNIEGAELARFARYADRIHHCGSITTELAVRWAKLPKRASPIYWARRLDIVRRFARHRALFDPATEIPPERLLGRSYRRPTPYIYSDEEIAAFLLAARELRSRAGLRPHTYEALLGLLACTGLRISEALRLSREDVDLSKGVLTIRASKFKKSRLVPLHTSATEHLCRYSDRRNHHHPLPHSPAFFLNEHVATPLTYRQTLMTFISLRTKLGWRGTKPPRIHDIRHTFTVNCLLRWYRKGLDVHPRMAALATYLGHVKITDTYWYLTAVPELLAIAADRFAHFASCSGESQP